ncbi:MAG: DUF4194 domain-containing protein [Synergistales bacterium]|nr:DUF4194 domain-containing protein [Synergistales bacterium]
MKISDSDELSSAVIPLLKGVVYRDEKPRVWEDLLKLQGNVRDYVAFLGLELALDEAEGYAFLSSKKQEEDEERELPRLVARRQLSYPVSLVMALLRKKLAEFDAGGGETRLIMSKDDVVEMIRIFLPDGSDDVKLIGQVDTILNKIADLGFIRRMDKGEGNIEVRRIIKAFVDAQWLSDFDKRLEGYRGQEEKDDE